MCRKPQVPCVQVVHITFSTTFDAAGPETVLTATDKKIVTVRIRSLTVLAHSVAVAGVFVFVGVAGVFGADRAVGFLVVVFITSGAELE